jgi:glycosyltransferase involved in cell wall biosynthesis
MLESVAAYRESGWDVTLALPGDGPLTSLISDAVVRLIDFPVLRKSLLRPLPLAWLVARMPAVLARLVRQIRSVRPDVVYVNTVTIPWWSLAARIARVPVVAHVHEAEVGVGRLLGLALNAPLLMSHVVIANSGHSARVAAHSVPSLVKKTVVVPNGIPDRGALAPADAGRSHVVYVGRLSPRKGTDVALDAVALLRQAGRDVTLEVCGSVFPGYEWFEAELRARANGPDLAGAVEFAGHVMPTTPVLARANVVVVPSRTEPFGNTAVEAMLAQRPLAASRVDGLAEIVTDGRTGRLVPPGDPRALADAVAEFLDDRPRAEEMAARARTDALARFSSERYRSDIVRVSAGLLQEAQAAAPEAGV